MNTQHYEDMIDRSGIDNGDPITTAQGVEDYIEWCLTEDRYGELNAEEYRAFGAEYIRRHNFEAEGGADPAEVAASYFG